MPPTSPTRSVAPSDLATPTFRAYLAPQNHGQAFFDPDLDQAQSMLSRNRQTLSTHGDEWSDLRRRARTSLIEDSVRYTSRYRDVQWATRILEQQGADATQIVMAGHQPTLFHPGVWFKNFALSRIGERTESISVNLVIDNDVATGGSIRVPSLMARSSAGSADIVYTSVPYDRAGGGVPFEQTTVEDRKIFDSFDKSVVHQIAPLVDNPCAESLWRHAKEAIDRCGVAGCALAQARHGLEAEVGLKTLELPMSVVARGSAFAQFAFWILDDLQRFHDCYNSSAQVYRRAHRIRSSAHPVPDLHREQDSDGATWYEAPLWVYGNSSPTRKPVWAKIVGDTLTISDRVGWTLQLNRRDRHAAIEQLSGAASPDCKIRPRALLTTMYARCVLSDLFLHGIGGGKYDQLGDMITQAFFGIQPTEFMVFSATVRLPDVQTKDFDEEIRRVRRRLRETVYQPENFSDEVPLDSELLKRKSELLSNIPPRGMRQAWHQEVTQVNRSLSASLGKIESDLRAQLGALRSAKESQSRLASREHSFCLFPLDYLVETFESLLSDTPDPHTAK